MTRINLGSIKTPALTTTTKEDEADFGTFSMSLRDMPKRARTQFKRLKNEGKVTGSMNDYMRRAFILQLERDDM